MYTIRKRKYSLKKQPVARKNTFKLRGGSHLQNQAIVSKNIQSSHPGIVAPVVDLVSGVASNVASTAVSGAGSFLGVNLSNKESVNNALKKQIAVLSDPETKENLKKLLGEGAKVVALGLESSQPAIEKFIQTTTKAVSNSAEKMGDAVINVGLNTLGGIPVVGAAIGAVRSLDKAVKAGQSVLNAGTEVIAASGDAVNQITQNIEHAKSKVNSMNFDVQKQLQDKIRAKTAILQKVGGSIAEFHDTTLNPEKFIPQTNTSLRNKKTILRKRFTKRFRKQY